MARTPLADPLAALDGGAAECLARVARNLLAGRPLHTSGRLPHARSIPAGLEFLEHRVLMPGDDPRHVDWRASGRSRTPLVRRYRDERAGEWLILLDRSASMGAAPGVWPLALQLAAAFAFLLLGLEHRVALALFSADLDQLQPPARGRLAYLALRRTLTAARPKGNGGASRLESCLTLAGKGRQAAVISDFLAPDAMGPALSRLRARCAAVHCFQVFHVLGAPAADDRREGGEADSLNPGPYHLVDAETGDALDLVVDGGLVRRAAERQRRLAAVLEQHCRSLNIRYSACAAGSPWDRVLLEHLVGRETHGA